MPSMITPGQWIQLVERVTGLSKEAALRSRRIEQVNAVLRETEAAQPYESERVAAVAAGLARSVFKTKPLRWIARSAQGEVAAATAAEFLRSCSWSIDIDGIERLAAELATNPSQHRLARCILATTSPPDTRQPNAEVYLSVPVSNRSGQVAALVNRWAAAIEAELEAVGKELGLNLFLRVPGRLESEPTDLLHSIRCGLRQSVLHLVIGAGGGSTGIGRETQASIARRRPRLR